MNAHSSEVKGPEPSLTLALSTRTHYRLFLLFEICVSALRSVAIAPALGGTRLGGLGAGGYFASPADHARGRIVWLFTGINPLMAPVDGSRALMPMDNSKRVLRSRVVCMRGASHT